MTSFSDMQQKGTPAATVVLEVATRRCSRTSQLSTAAVACFAFIPVACAVFPDLLLDISHLTSPQIKRCLGGFAGHWRQLRRSMVHNIPWQPLQGHINMLPGTDTGAICSDARSHHLKAQLTNKHLFVIRELLLFGH